jgi:lysophospholipase L1-like esterase
LTQRRDALAALTSLAALPLLSACASQQTTAPAPVLTDPVKPPLVLPEPAKAALPSLVLIGDSTVRNGWDDGQGLGPVGQWGWGHVLARLLDPAQINVVNRAIGGLSSRTYRTGGHWDRTRAFIKRGDVVLIQFGHNDSSAINDNSRARGTIRGIGTEQQAIDNLLTKQKETVYSYGEYLRRYVAEIRAIGATPVICSPIPRKRFDAAGKTVRSTESYAGWAAAVAQEQGVGFIDLDRLIAERYDALGPLVVAQLFPRTQPEERVHPNWAGSALNAQIVREQLRALKLLPEAVFEVPQAKLTATIPPVPPITQPLDARKPTLFLVGDSTVRSAGQNGNWGWGEFLAPLLDTERIQLANHAMGGRSTRTFLREGRWAAVRSPLRAGDTVLIQFGHNDGGRVGDPNAKQRGVLPGIGPETAQEQLPDGQTETVHSFGVYLSRYVREILDAGAVPVILSPVPHKDRWEKERDFADFAAWGQAVAKQQGALFIDLTLLVTERYQAIGAAQVATLFADARTHTNEAGAKLNAGCVIQGLKQLPQAWLQPYLKA